MLSVWVILKSFRDGSQDICKDTESNLGPFAGSVLRLKLFRSKLYLSFRAEQHVKNNYELILQSALCFFCLFVFFYVLFSAPPRPFFSSKSSKETSEKMFPFKV